MLNYNAETQTISMIAKDTGDFVISLDNYLLAEGDKVFFTVNDKLEQETALISIVVSEFVDNKAVIGIYNLNAFVNGDIQDCIDHLIIAENAERMKEQEL